MGQNVVVIGSGAAGLAAALSAARSGAAVTVVERAPYIGGTTALSGGIAWMPCNGRTEDNAEDAEAYLASLAVGDGDPELNATYIRCTRETVDALEEATRVRMLPLAYPDYHAERPGGRPEGGRSLEPDALVPRADVLEILRPSPNIAAPITYRELTTGRLDRDEVERRRQAGFITLGRALIAGLAEAILDLGGEISVGERARELVREDGRVTGVVTDRRTLPGSVVLASGGFERNEALARTFLRGPLLAPAGVGTNEGDGLLMAMAAGAALGNMNEAWWCPAMTIPGEEIDGQQLHRLVLTERARPGTIIVDGLGRRFVDEAQNYNDLGRGLHAFDAGTFSFPRIPAWVIFDGEYRRRYRFGILPRGGADPDWLIRADRLEDLAEAIEVPADALVETVERFNGMVAQGADTDHGRGSRAYDRFIGDAKAPDPNLGALTEPPFYAIRIRPGCLGTKGGPKTDDSGRVRGLDGAPISGLYAAGNAAASPFGMAYPGAGGTIGPALVFGWRAGAAATAD